MNNIPIKKIRSVFTVKNKSFLTPHFIRVVFDIREDQLPLLSEVTSGSNNKIFIPPKGVRLIYFPERGREINSELVATVRTYTNRSIDLEKRELTIDFVVHGENGPASAWAINAQAGDCLGIGMKQSHKPLLPISESYLLVGDATAVPVISAILEQLAVGITAKVFLEVTEKSDELMLCSAAFVDVMWLHNKEPEKGSLLSSCIKQFQIDNPAQNNCVYIAAEYSTVKDLKAFFRVQLGWDPDFISTTAYWKSGASEEATVEKQQGTL